MDSLKPLLRLQSKALALSLGMEKVPRLWRCLLSKQHIVNFVEVRHSQETEL